MEPLKKGVQFYRIVLNHSDQLWTKWNNIEEIAKNLEETYSEEEIPNENDLAYLKEMVMSLNDFEDHDV